MAVSRSPANRRRRCWSVSVNEDVGVAVLLFVGVHGHGRHGHGELRGHFGRRDTYCGPTTARRRRPRRRASSVRESAPGSGSSPRRSWTRRRHRRARPSWPVPCSTSASCTSLGCMPGYGVEVQVAGDALRALEHLVGLTVRRDVEHDLDSLCAAVRRRRAAARRRRTRRSSGFDEPRLSPATAERGGRHERQDTIPIHA